MTFANLCAEALAHQFFFVIWHALPSRAVDASSLGCASGFGRLGGVASQSNAGEPLPATERPVVPRSAPSLRKLRTLNAEVLNREVILPIVGE